MKSVVIIPARYKSSRFPGKPLVKIRNKEMILHVAERAAQAVDNQNVYVATDDVRIKDVVLGAGFNVIMTSDELTGTDRVASASLQVDADIYINVQGDEPLINPDDIKKIIQTKKENMQSVINACKRIDGDSYINNVNIPKVAMNEKGKLIYMSRAPIPFTKTGISKKGDYYKQVCIYGFSQSELKAFKNFGRKSQLENQEDIEILRFLELGIEVLMIPVCSNVYAVDVPDDLRIVKEVLESS